MSHSLWETRLMNQGRQVIKQLVKEPTRQPKQVEPLRNNLSMTKLRNQLEPFMGPTQRLKKPIMKNVENKSKNKSKKEIGTRNQLEPFMEPTQRPKKTIVRNLKNKSKKIGTGTKKGQQKQWPSARGWQKEPCGGGPQQQQPQRWP